MVMKIKQLRVNSNRRSRTAPGPLGRKLYWEPRQHPKGAISTKRKESLGTPYTSKTGTGEVGKGKQELTISPRLCGLGS